MLCGRLQEAWLSDSNVRSTKTAGLKKLHSLRTSFLVYARRDWFCAFPPRARFEKRTVRARVKVGSTALTQRIDADLNDGWNRFAAAGASHTAPGCPSIPHPEMLDSFRLLARSTIAAALRLGGILHVPSLFVLPVHNTSCLEFCILHVHAAQLLKRRKRRTLVYYNGSKKHVRGQ